MLLSNYHYVSDINTASTGKVRTHSRRTNIVRSRYVKAEKRKK